MRGWKSIVSILLLWTINCQAFLYLINNQAYIYYPRELILPVPCRTHAQPKKLTLKDAILLSLRTNPNVQSGEIQRVADKFALEVAHNTFEPQYIFNASTSFVPGSKPQTSISPQVSLLTPTGAQLQLNYNGSYLGAAGNGSTTTFTLTQPLLRGFGPTVTMAPLVQAEYSEANARLNLKNTIMATITQVIQNYYSVVQAYNNLTVDELALENSLTLLHQYQVRIRAGQAAPLEAAPQQSQVASQQLQVTQDKNAIQQAYQALLTTLGLDPNSKIDIDKNIYVVTPKIPSYERSVALALENNIGYLQSLYQLKQDELDVIVNKDQQRWQLNAVVTKSFTTTGSGAPVISSSTTGATTTTTTAASGDSVVLNLNIPINNKQLQQQLVNAQVSLEQQRINVAETKRQLSADVMTNVQTLFYQWQQILQAQNAVAYAQQAFDVEVKKLYYGRSTVLNVTQLRDSLTTAKLSLISQEISYINTLAQFEQNVGVTLDTWGIQVYY